LRTGGSRLAAINSNAKFIHLARARQLDLILSTKRWIFQAMKQMFAFLTLCLVLTLGATAYAQQPGIKVTANGTTIENGRLELNTEKRILWVIEDGKPQGVGYAYEIGPLWLVPTNGEKVQLKPKQLLNGPAMYYTVRKTQLTQYPDGFELQLEAVVRYNPDRSFETLPFSSKDLKVKFIPVQ
jgi:hypothetical protein